MSTFRARLTGLLTIITALITLAAILTYPSTAVASPVGGTAQSSPSTMRTDTTPLVDRLPRPGAHGIPATPLTFTSNGSAKAGSVEDIIVCEGTSEVLYLSAGSFRFIAGKGKSSCSAPIDYLSVQTYIYEYIPELGDFREVAIGDLDYGPGLVRNSATQASCFNDHTYVAGSYHEFRHQGQVARGWSNSRGLIAECSFP